MKKALKKAAKKEVDNILHHFKKDGWDLDYSLVVTNIFYEAFGHHLEQYLWDEIRKKKSKVLKNMILIIKDKQCVLRYRRKNEKPTKKSRS